MPPLCQSVRLSAYSFSLTRDRFESNSESCSFLTLILHLLVVSQNTPSRLVINTVIFTAPGSWNRFAPLPFYFWPTAHFYSWKCCAFFSVLTNSTNRRRHPKSSFTSTLQKNKGIFTLRFCTQRAHIVFKEKKTIWARCDSPSVFTHICSLHQTDLDQIWRGYSFGSLAI